MTGTAIPNARTTRWAVSRWSTRARRSRPPTSGGATDDDGRASIAGRCPEPTGSEHRRERQRPRSGTTAEATHVVDRGAERVRSGAMSAADVAAWKDPIPELDSLGAVHFIGIGGAGLGGIAPVQLARRGGGAGGGPPG